MTIKLRDYQTDSLEKLDRYLIKGGGKSGIWHLATGLGKTVLTTHAINEFWDPRKGYRSLIVGGVNRVVTWQMLQALRSDFGYMNGNYIIDNKKAVPMSGIVMAKDNQVDARVLVASIQSLVSGVDLTKLGKIDNPMGQVIERSDFEIDRMGNIRKAKNSKRPYLITPRMDEVLMNGGLFDVWIHDEAHHSPADGSVFVIKSLDQIRMLLDMEPMRIIGNTATPARADDRGLHTLYERVIASYPIDWAQRHGYLVPFAEPKRIVVDTVEVDAAGNGSPSSDKKQTIRYVDNWAEIVAQGYMDEMQGRKCFAYWSQYNGPSAVEDSIYASNIQNSMGIRSVHVDGQKCIGMQGEVLPKNQERKLLEAIAAGRIDIINNHHVLIEGVNVPAVDGIILGLRVAAENPVTITQIIGRALRLAPGKKDMKLLEVTGQAVAINSIADLTGYAVDPLSGGYIEKLDPYGIVQLFMQLWATRTSDVERWIVTQKRFKESTIREAIDLALRDSSGQDLADTHLRALNDCNKSLTDENTLIDGMDLKDVRQDGMVRGINQSYELIKIEQKSAGTWYVDNHSALMSISLSKTDSFVIHPPNHTYARIARAACEVIVGDDDTHPLIRGKTIEQREKLMEFFTTCQRFYQSFTLWHLCGEYYNLSLKQPLWVLEDEALDVLESDALAYGRDNIENYTAKFSEKKKAQSWKNDEATLAQHKAAAQVLGVPILGLPEEVKMLSKGAIAKFINHNACVKYLAGEKSPIPKLNAAIERIKEIV